MHIQSRSRNSSFQSEGIACYLSRRLLLCPTLWHKFLLLGSAASTCWGKKYRWLLDSVYTETPKSEMSRIYSRLVCQPWPGRLGCDWERVFKKPAKRYNRVSLGFPSSLRCVRRRCKWNMRVYQTTCESMIKIWQDFQCSGWIILHLKGTMLSSCSTSQSMHAIHLSYRAPHPCRFLRFTVRYSTGRNRNIWLSWAEILWPFSYGT